MYGRWERRKGEAADLQYYVDKPETVLSNRGLTSIILVQTGKQHWNEFLVTGGGRGPGKGVDYQIP